MRRLGALNLRTLMQPAIGPLLGSGSGLSSGSFLPGAPGFSFRRRLSRGVALALLAVACSGGGSTQRSGDPTQPSGDPTQPSGDPTQPSGDPTQPSGAIGAEGGTVTSRDGGATLIVPPNALAARTALSITAVPDDLDPRILTLSVYSVMPTSTQFAVPATLKLRYSSGQTLIPGTDLGIHRLGSSGWTADAPSTIAPGADFITTSITAGGTYGLRWMEGAGPCTGAEYRQFDFWLGSWHVSGDPSRTAEVEAEVNGCAIVENFQSQGGAAHEAVMRYSPADQKWHRTEVADWWRVEMSGTLESGAMLLYASPTERSVWTPGVDEVHYVEEMSYDGGMTWKGGFQWTFVRH